MADDKRSGSEPGSIANEGHDELSLEYWLERISCSEEIVIRFTGYNQYTGCLKIIDQTCLIVKGLYTEFPHLLNRFVYFMKML